MRLYDKRCGKCNKLLSYIEKQFGSSYRFDFFHCNDCKKDYILRTNINGESKWIEEIYD